MRRSHLPVVEYGTCAGVRVAAPAEPRRLFDRLRPSRATPEHTSFEGALAGVHREFTRPADDVVIVGGGYGITTVAAATQGASVTVYEPTPDRLAALERTLLLNGVTGADVSLRAAIVGELAPAEADEKGLDDEGVSRVAPAALPSCDVLELDCEGAELSILQNLDPAALPRILAVEVHPIKLDGRADEVVPRLVDLGYEIERYLTHDGVALSRPAFADLRDGRTPDVGGADHQEYPPVVVATRAGSDGEAAAAASADDHGA